MPCAQFYFCHPLEDPGPWPISWLGCCHLLILVTPAIFILIHCHCPIANLVICCIDQPIKVRFLLQLLSILFWWLWCAYRTTLNEIDTCDLLSGPVIIERHFWRTIIRRGLNFGASGVSTYHQRMNSSNTTFCSIQSWLGLIAIEMIHWITHILLEGTTRRQEKQICHGGVYVPSLWILWSVLQRSHSLWKVVPSVDAKRELARSRGANRLAIHPGASYCYISLLLAYLWL